MLNIGDPIAAGMRICSSDLPLLRELKVGHYLLYAKVCAIKYINQPSLRSKQAFLLNAFLANFQGVAIIYNVRIGNEEITIVTMNRYIIPVRRPNEL